MKISFILSGSEWAQRCKGKKEKEKITRADTKKYNLNSEMTEQVEMCGVASTVSPTAETQRKGGRGSRQANVKRIHGHPACSLVSEWDLLFPLSHLL